MVYGDVHKPEIFTDREGKPQVSLDITAVHLEFSPFGSGKPNQNQTNEPQGQPFSGSFGAEPPANPFVDAGAVQGKGETFDDEVPF